MSQEKRKVVDLRWLDEGREDEFGHYLQLERKDLPMSYFSDDELGNCAFMEYDRAPEVEMAMMVKHHQEKTLDQFHSRIAIMTAVKERLRWLSRRVAVLEGRYPGVPSPMIPNPLFSSVKEAENSINKNGIYFASYNDENKTFALDGYFNEQDLEALLYIYRNKYKVVGET